MPPVVLLSGQERGGLAGISHPVVPGWFHWKTTWADSLVNLVYAIAHVLHTLGLVPCLASQRYWNLLVGGWEEASHCGRL